MSEKLPNGFLKPHLKERESFGATASFVCLSLVAHHSSSDSHCAIKECRILLHSREILRRPMTNACIPSDWSVWCWCRWVDNSTTPWDILEVTKLTWVNSSKVQLNATPSRVAKDAYSRHWEKIRSFSSTVRRFCMASEANSSFELMYLI